MTASAEGRGNRLLDLVLYAAAALVPLAFVVWSMRLWEHDLSVPFFYERDALYFLATIKGWLETGSYLEIPALGAPGTGAYYDFPLGDGLIFLLVRLLGLVDAGPGLAFNVVYLWGYPTVGLAAAFASRRLGASRRVAFVVAILFALLPYHWQRGREHLTLSVYWIVPLAVLVLAWLASPRPPLVERGADGRLRLRLRDPRALGALAICAVAGATGTYYVFYLCFFLALVGLRGLLGRRDPRPALAAAILVVAAVAVLAIQLAPTFAYTAENGRNAEAANRNPSQSEVYGLRVTYLFLPHGEHRIPLLARVATEYRTYSHDADTEARWSSLGIAGFLGFVAAIAAVLIRWPRWRRRLPGPGDEGSVTLRWLGVLTLAAVLLGMVAGFGTVLAGILYAADVPPLFRSNTRISIFIAFFALTALGLLADRALAWRSSRRWGVALTALLALVLVGGVLDETPADLSAGLAEVRATYAADEALVAELASALPAGASVLQLPYVPYPEDKGPAGMKHYDHIRGYLHSTSLRWSYGAMRGREDDRWQRETTALPVPELVERARAAGFSAIWVQLNGYEDGGAAIIGELEAELGAPMLVERGGEIRVWDLDAPPSGWAG